MIQRHKTTVSSSAARDGCLASKVFCSAKITLARIETIHMIRKGQMKVAGRKKQTPAAQYFPAASFYWQANSSTCNTRPPSHRSSGHPGYTAKRIPVDVYRGGRTHYGEKFLRYIIDIYGKRHTPYITTAKRTSW